MNKIYLSLGTNIGDREYNLKLAVKMLYEMDGISVKKVSSIYETAPVGYVDQPSFLNIVVLVESNRSAFEMLEICQTVENDLGRVREIRWGPRIIDLDILLFNQDNIEAENLIVPHARMFERAFVLVPLLEIADEPLEGFLAQAQKVLTLLDIDQEGVKKWKATTSVEQFIY
ncbi:2-amino-4-hydroxy-6-hydroxymethyldihydropteridine diphosphokinase [Ureibacillus endophyticus]|uniref:2-amino-4-hydroxy-6-hydroxymethyldihydropteridine diphosphokinase n=1 Tax=Ureibacillus endophyticus TaxID=1978490 RepID=A0A494YX39_9BACL|nr:2-amino-4-hydroxy-6-hydroxymethyldihydropteridine diphosphokinase [Lysinibacillus endophyticus]RKQ14714.1 2-amino-4-hydroxy-6-hydroxymethyldihydropteridine diphosphokinase [Lysinibacillus endophyticus]